MSMKTVIASVAGAAISGSAIAGGGHVVTFDHGPEGWSVNGAVTIIPDGGNPGAHLRHIQIDTFGCSIRTDSNPVFVTDFTVTGPVKLSVDIKVNSITFFGNEVPRELVLELRDYDVEGFPYNSVWFHGGDLPAPGEGWKTFEFTIDNVHDTELPPGWGGTGDEDPNTYEPILPANRTWTDMLQSVNEVQFTTFVPGWFYGFTNFDFEVDNISITPLTPDCPADLNGSGTVDLDDLNIVLSNFGQQTSNGDVNGDGVVDLDDLNAVLAAFGTSC